MSKFQIGDEVRDADGVLWTVLNRPHADLSSGEPCNGLFQRHWGNRGQRYGEHMRRPLVAARDEFPVSVEPRRRGFWWRLRAVIGGR